MRLAWPARRNDDAGKMGQAGEQLRGAGDDLVRRPAVQGFFHLAHLPGSERLDGEQAVDEQAIAARRRHPAGRGMRAGDEAGFFEVGHDVADRCRRQVEAGELRQRARTDRLAVGNVVFDQGLEQGAGAFIEHGAIVQKSGANAASRFYARIRPHEQKLRFR
jgi:hypothetical protein